MGNSHCVPQAPRRLQASFSRKPSLRGSRDDGARRLAGLFGTAAGPDGDSPADKIFYYIPGTASWGGQGPGCRRDASRQQEMAFVAHTPAGGRPRLPGAQGCACSGQEVPGPESQQEGLEQPFLSVFKKGRRRVPVRNLGKVVHYAKVQLRFQHSQDVSDCYLELFPAHLYFQAHGAEGLTLQGLLPLAELTVCPLEGPGEHGFQITGPLPTPLLVLCPGPAEQGRWLYHLEKQTAVARGLRRCPSAPPQGPPEDELPWSLQRRLSGLRTAPGRWAAGGAICASRVQLQHLPAQEQWDRLLVLYPASLAIFSEEAAGLCFKGELPLSAVSVNLEEEEKQIRSFLIEGPLTNSIRVLCASYEDYSRWLLCLQAAAHRLRGPTRPGPGRPHRGRWGTAAGVPSPLMDAPAGAPPRTSHSLPESSAAAAPGRPAAPAAVSGQRLGVPGPVVLGCRPAQQDLTLAAAPRTPVGEAGTLWKALVPQGQDGTGCSSIGRRTPELRRSSRQSPRGTACGQGRSPAPPLHLDLTKLAPDAGPEAPAGPLDTPRSPLYADPYTPPATSHHRVMDVRGLDEVSPGAGGCEVHAGWDGPAASGKQHFLQFCAAMQSPLGPAPPSPCPLVPVSVPVSDPGSGLSTKGAPQAPAPPWHQGSVKGRGPAPPGSPRPVCPARDSPACTLPAPPDGRPPVGIDSIWGPAPAPLHQRWPRLRAPETGVGLVQWI
ncbi:Pleckstrin homology domain-containing family N member 1 [Galemys pyrenaicus]|uniref:Pleckstrin homology domain-containing family N member 1 n=1 Tax=Galemys pyrenaicus TaxID=202257 RepID=A0A8J5ZE07_GALPY|nr:Pleckstrin homology domain-containing family N member 1 [Galemys pyrenaicus]